MDVKGNPVWNRNDGSQLVVEMSDAGVPNFFTRTKSGTEITTVVGASGVSVVQVLTSNTAAANAAIINAATAGATAGATLQFPEGTFQTSTIVHPGKPLLWRGAGRNATVITAPSGDLFQLTAEIDQGFGFEHMSLVSATGHVFNQTALVSRGFIQDCYLLTQGTSKSIWYCNNQILLDMLFDNNEYANVAASESMFLLTSTGGWINTNTWRRSRFSNSAVKPAIYIIQNDTASYNYDNNFQDLNFELCDYGCIWATSASNYIIQGCRAYDTTTFQDHIFYFGKTGAGLASKNVTVIGSGRVTGTMVSGAKYDFAIQNANRVVIINCAQNAITLAVDSPQNACLIDEGRIKPQSSTNYEMSGDNGNADLTLNPGNQEMQLFQTTLTANRTVTLNTSGAKRGDRFVIIRSGLGAFTLNVGGLVTIPASTKARVEVSWDANSAAWILTDYTVIGGTYITVPVNAGASAATNGTTITAAIAAAAAGTILVFPPGTFQTTTIALTKALRFQGAGRMGTVLTAPSGDLFTIGVEIDQGLGFEHMSLISATGHVFNQTALVSRSWIQDCYLLTQGTSKSIWLCNNQILIDMLFDNNEYANVAASESFFLLTSTGGWINSNTWRKSRFTNAASKPAIYIIQNDTGSYNYDNNFYDLTFETCDYGCVWGTSASNWIVQGCRAYDTTTFQDHLFFFGKTGSGLASKNVTAIGSGRVAGAMVSGSKYDFAIQNANRVVIMNCANNSITLAIDSPQNACLIDEGRIKPQSSTNYEMSGDNGDGNLTLNPGNQEMQLFQTALTANRTITLGTTGAKRGDRFVIIRSGLGAFTLAVGALKTIPNSTAARVEVAWDANSAAWILVGYSVL
jgi:hypothetical protein